MRDLFTNHHQLLAIILFTDKGVGSSRKENVDQWVNAMPNYPEAYWLQLNVCHVKSANLTLIP